MLFLIVHKKSIYLFLVVFLFSISLNGQITQFQEHQIEQLIENLDNSEDLDFNTLFEELEYYLSKPLNLNKADEEVLKSCRLFNDIQIAQILSHRADYGDFISVHELQAIPSFDLKTIKALSSFVTVGGGLYDYNLPLTKMFTQGKSELYIKTRRILESQAGYERPFEEGGYEGDPNRIYVRYKFYHENRLKLGFVTEKDAGESFFSGSNKQGFDYASAHFHLKEYNTWLKDLIIGDYNVSLGQGLIVHNGFGTGKSSYVMSLKKGGRTVRSYNSVNESNFYRGAALSLAFGKNIKTTVFGSHKKIDGTIPDVDIDIGFESVSAIVNSGLHRTKNEIAKKDTLSQSSVGGTISFVTNRFKLGLNVLHERYNVPLVRSASPANLYRFNGDALTNLSFDHSYRWKNLHLFGESAMSDNGAMANLHGLLMGLDKKMDLGVLYRKFDVDYHAFNSNSFAETTGTNNEEGFYTAVILRPANQWTLSAYFDIWQHPWLRQNRDAPSVGKEYLLNVNYYKKRKLDIYLQYKYEQKDRNVPFDVAIDRLGPETLHRLRLHVAHTVNKEWTLRNRIELSRFIDLEKVSKGFMIYQDLIYKPISSPFSFTGRYAIFDTYDGDSRIYAYENDIMYEFYIPQFSGRGTRYYINLRYDISRWLTAEFRYAKTSLSFKRDSNGEVIRNLYWGTGGERIDGNERSDIKAQLRFRF